MTRLGSDLAAASRSKQTVGNAQVSLCDPEALKNNAAKITAWANELLDLIGSEKVIVPKDKDEAKPN